MRYQRAPGSGALRLASILVAVVAAAPSPAAAPLQEDDSLRLGRARVDRLTVARGSAAVRSVLLENSGSATVQVTRVSAKGDPLTVRLVRQRVSVDVALGEAMQYELPAKESAQIELTIDAREQPLGERAATLAIEAGGRTLELPVAWEVVEPRQDADDERPIARPRTDLSRFAPKGPPPILACDRYLYDFGKVLSGEQLTTQITLRNEGQGELVLVKVGAQCHCTLPRLTLPGGVVTGKQLANDEVYGSLKAHEEARLDIEVDTSGMIGFIKKTIELITNDAVRSPQRFTLTMEVENPMQFSPASVNLGDVRRGERAEQVVRMTSRALGRFSVIGYELKQPQPFDVEYRPVEPKEEEACAWELVLRPRDGLPCGTYSGRLRLELDHERLRSLDQLHYRMRVVPDVQWTFERARSPERITLGAVRSGQNDVQTLLLENKNRKVPYVPREATIVSKLGSEPYATEIVELEKGQRYEVKIKVVSAPRTKAFSGDLFIRSDSPTVPELKISFSGIWNGPPAEAKAPPSSGGGK